MVFGLVSVGSFSVFNGTNKVIFRRFGSLEERVQKKKIIADNFLVQETLTLRENLALLCSKTTLQNQGYKKIKKYVGIFSM